MKRARRWRYCCDHCGKCGGSGGHMHKHEAGCTANHRRVCGYCAQARPVAELIQVLGYRGTDWKAGMAAHREATHDRPDCLLTVIRQEKFYQISFALAGRIPKPSLAGLPLPDRIMDLYLDFAKDRSRRQGWIRFHAPQVRPFRGLLREVRGSGPGDPRRRPGNVWIPGGNVVPQPEPRSGDQSRVGHV